MPSTRPARPTPASTTKSGALKTKKSFSLFLAAQLIAAQLIATQLSACGHFRTYTNYSYRKLGEEKKTKKLKKKTYTKEIVFHDDAYWLKLTEQRHCKKLKQDILEESATVEVKAPLSWYYVGGGALVAGLAIPFYYLAGTSKSSERRRNNALVGSFLFLLPGLALLGFGIYQRFVAGSETKTLGKTKKVSDEEAFICGTAPVVDEEVKLGTRTGTQPVGKTNKKGEVKLPHRSIQPLIRYRFNKIVKVYLDVILGTDNLGEINVPWPTKRPRE